MKDVFQGFHFFERVVSHISMQDAQHHVHRAGTGLTEAVPKEGATGAPACGSAGY
jgi:hypothetical protein